MLLSCPKIIGVGNQSRQRVSKKISSDDSYIWSEKKHPDIYECYYNFVATGRNKDLEN